MGARSRRNLAYFPCLALLTLMTLVSGSNIQYPQGYYPFEESPARIPPKVRKPPYLQTQVKCPGAGGPTQEQTLDNLCGDLNKGYLPVNPIGQNVLGVSYPFELIKNKTLDFFSKTLPILKADDTLPKVAKYQDSHIMYNPTIFNSQPNTKIRFYENERSKREASENENAARHEPPIPELEDNEETARQARGWCDDSLGVFCLLFNVIKGDNEDNERSKREASENENIARQEPPAPELEDNEGTARQARGWCDDSFGVFCMLFNAIKGDNEGRASERLDTDPDINSLNSLNSLDQPMTPCPSAVEYVTPVFAKNYQGVWRYVVQIPYEGYFTQTVEVVKCLSTKCEFLEGSCLASPRWVSLLVAEIYYPDTYFPNVADQPIQGRDPIKASPPSDFNQYLLKRSGQSQTESRNCDGHDELGCYHVRLYYDWFLIPGSCKCWKNDFFSQYSKK